MQNKRSLAKHITKRLSEKYGDFNNEGVMFDILIEFEDKTES